MSVERKHRPSGYITPTERGQIVNEKDLIEALEQKRIGRAGLDVFEQEPPSLNSPHFKGNPDNLVATAHIGGSTEEALARIGEITITNIGAALQGKLPPNPAKFWKKPGISKSFPFSARV